MPNLYEITAQIESLMQRAIDPTTGEIIDAELDKILDALNADRDKRALDIAAASIDIEAEAEKIDRRAKELLEWSKTLYNKAERLKRYIARCIPEGHRVSDDRVRLSWRRSERVVIDNADQLPDTCVTLVRTPLAAVIKEYLKDGVPLAGARLETRQNLQVK